MEAIKFSSTIFKNGELLLKDFNFKKGDMVESIIIFNDFKNNNNSYLTGKQLANSEVVGIWSDRNIKDSTVYANILRNQAEQRETK